MGKKYRTLYDREQEELRKNNYKKYTGEIHRGDIFYFDKSYTVGVEQQGGRPGIIVSNDACNSTSEFLLVCYLTTQPKTDLPTHVPIMCEQQSICLCEQVHTLSKEKMQKYYCSATPEEMKEVDKALSIGLGIDINNILPKDYKKLLKQLENENKNIKKDFEKIIAEKDEYIATLEDDVYSLSNGIRTYKEKADYTNIIQSIENAPEYIRVCAERDVYMKLYNDLLNRK